jgi:hypothetical protein
MGNIISRLTKNSQLVIVSKIGLTPSSETQKKAAAKWNQVGNNTSRGCIDALSKV